MRTHACTQKSGLISWQSLKNLAPFYGMGRLLTGNRDIAWKGYADERPLKTEHKQEFFNDNRI